MCDLTDNRDVTIGIHDYHFHWSGGLETPPVYQLDITRNLTGSQPNPVMTLTFCGVNSHCFAENRDYRDCIVNALSQQFEVCPPDDTEED